MELMPPHSTRLLSLIYISQYTVGFLREHTTLTLNSGFLLLILMTAVL